MQYVSQSSGARPEDDPSNDFETQSSFKTSCFRPYDEALKEFIKGIKRVQDFGEFTLFVNPDFSPEYGGIRLLTRSLRHLDIGGKALGLLSLAHDGYSIPRTLLIPGSFFPEEAKALPNDSHQRTLLLSKALNQKTKLIMYLCRQMGFQDPSMFRSSGSEDSIQHTGAGLWKSNFFLPWATTAEVAYQLARVYESSFSKDAIAFHAKYGRKASAVGIVVNEVCGNSFTNDSENFFSPKLSVIADSANPNKIRLKITEGLGTKVVSQLQASHTEVPVDTLRVEICRRQARNFITGKLLNTVDHLFVGEKSCYPTSIPEIEIADSLLSNISKIVASQVASMTSKHQSAWDTELVFPTLDATQRLEPIYVQRRPVRCMDPSFRIETLGRKLVTSDAVIGQKSISSSTVLYISENESSMMDASEKVEVFNKEHPEGYVIFIHQSGRAYAQPIQYFAYSNAKAFVFIYDNYSQNDRISTVDHFSQCIRSEGKPVVIISKDRFKRNSTLKQFEGDFKITMLDGEVLVVAANEYVPTAYLAIEKQD